MFGSKTRYSAAQFLGLQEASVIRVLLGKNGVDTSWMHPATMMENLIHVTTSSDDGTMMSVLDEITRTQKDLRSRVSPKERFDERFDDLQKCLLLDGFVIENKQLRTLDPSIRDAPPIDEQLFSVVIGKCALSGLGALACADPHASEAAFKKLAVGRQAILHPGCGLKCGLVSFFKNQKRQSPE